jgi:hypothetical protein
MHVTASRSTATVQRYPSHNHPLGPSPSCRRAGSDRVRSVTSPRGTAWGMPNGEIRWRARPLAGIATGSVGVPCPLVGRRDLDRIVSPRCALSTALSTLVRPVNGSLRRAGGRRRAGDDDRIFRRTGRPSNAHSDYVRAVIAARSEGSVRTTHFEGDCGLCPSTHGVLRSAIENASPGGRPKRASVPRARCRTGPGV